MTRLSSKGQQCCNCCTFVGDVAFGVNSVVTVGVGLTIVTVGVRLFAVHVEQD